MAPFLTARWKNLCLISYYVPRGLLELHLPRGLELDVPPGAPEGMGAVSLVAFEFLDTRVFGVPWPRHVNFPEINLRFYVRRGDERGVCFIREFVPRPLIAMIAKRVYNEPYMATGMTSSFTEVGGRLRIEHRLEVRGARPSWLRVTASREASLPREDTLDHWFKEHQWGFGRSRKGEAIVYEVRHPRWAVHQIEEVDLDLDWTGLYGSEWGYLRDRPTTSVVLAQGSPVEVHSKRILK